MTKARRKAIKRDRLLPSQNVYSFVGRLLVYVRGKLLTEVLKYFENAGKVINLRVFA